MNVDVMRRVGDDLAPEMNGRRVTLRPVTRRDYDYLYELAVDPRSSFRWRLRGTTPDPRSFEQLLWDQILVQFLVVRSQTQQPIGLVSCFAPDLRSGVGNIAALVHPDAIGSGLAGDALALMIDYIFRLWNVRTLYADTPEFNYTFIASGADRLFSVEARVPDRYWHQGRYWDNVILAVKREQWERIAPRILRAVRSNVSRPAGDD